MADDKTTAPLNDAAIGSDSAGRESAAAPAPVPVGPPPSQFASSLWGTNQWEESEWAPASSGLSATSDQQRRPPPEPAVERTAAGPRVIGAYAVLKPLGDESDGLFLARHTKLERVVSLKALTLPDVDDAKALEAFVARARVAARLRDPHLIEIHDFVEHTSLWFAVTEPLFGESLRSRARRAPLTIAAAISVIEETARALAVLRRAHRGHGAVTSRSIFLVERGRVVDQVELLDFGAGSQQDALVAFSELAPERKDGAEPDARGDVWGLGSVLFELLEGRPPSEAGALSPVSRSRQPIPPLLAELIARCLQQDPRARFSSVESMALALPHALGLAPRPLPSKTSYPALQRVVSAALPAAPAAQPAPASPRRRAWKALTLALGPLAAAGWWLAQDPPPAPEEPRVEVPAPAVPPPAEVAPPEVHPILLQSAGNKLLGGAAIGALAEIRLEPVVKKKKKAGPGRRR